MSLIDFLWYRKKGLTNTLCVLPLLPLSFLYRSITAVRRCMYDKGIKKSGAPAVAVVVIGGVTVGGSGKTPLCTALLRQLKKDGYTPGLLSRGYKGSSEHYPLLVESDSDVSECGDEPLLIKRALGDDAVVVVDPVRVRGAEYLSSQGVDVIVTDDGLQHYALERDVEVIVLDGARMLGNRRLMPAGPLREGVWRLDTVDAIVVNGSNIADPRYFVMKLEPSAPKSLGKDKNMTITPGSQVCAMAGIGNPQRFDRTLESLGYEVAAAIKVPDHGRVNLGIIKTKAAEYPVVMTAKDAVKYGDEVLENCFVVEIEAKLSPLFYERIRDKIKRSCNRIQNRADFGRSRKETAVSTRDEKNQ